MAVFDEIGDAVRDFGFSLRGAFRPSREDSVPLLLDGRATRTVLLVGSAGPQMWEHFQAEMPDGPNPLDAWTERKIGKVVEQFGARVVYPFERPFFPFQRWLRRADPSRVSPLRILIHPEYGLWHAVRAVLLFAESHDIPEKSEVTAPCKDCRDRPCMTACPVNAFSARGLDTARCAAHLASPDGSDCMATGCLARRACPIGRSFQHAPDQAAFHMAALLEHHRIS